MTDVTDDLPLAGITVVAMEQAVAAPLGTRHLADLGARVIKIERVGEGDFARSYDSAVNGIAAHFVWLNRGKESVALDLKDPAGVDVVHRLLAGADVFVQNAAPGVVERLGLGGEDLAAAYPQLVVVNISGYGTAGPFRDRKAYDMLVQAETGLISITGSPDAPAKTGVPTSDIAAGLYTAQSVLAALLKRGRSGRGAVIDVSMFDATVEWLGYPMYLQMYGGRQVPRMGLSHTSIAPYDAFPTADGQILIGVQNDRGWRALVEVLGLSGLADDPRLATNQARVEHRQECDGAIAGATRGFSTEDLDRRLAEAGVPAAQLNSIGDLVEHPQLSARDRWREVGTPAGPVSAVLPPATWRDLELAMGDVPGLGEHTDAVLGEVGLDRAARDDLAQRGTIGRATDTRTTPRRSA